MTTRRPRSRLTDAEFLEALEDCTLPPREFDHRGHVRLAYLSSVDGDFPTALARVQRTIRAYAAELGKSDKYHETITVAFLALVRERLWKNGPGADFEEFESAHPDLFDADLLARHYTPEVLGSPIARQTFVLPDARD
ncbi:hypothetical protein RZO50_01965 [Microbacterium sp. SSW1-59]|uniref:hypothetical protein n=1 Tax=Microbacterium xanthum TaxID=3079794 RepID=UPI002AD2F9F7|nr:hypothetical protein [Microbacterium sp. SSW1-59]MDZ8200263.1 hypothetical protein [Microbacterium sp. SSW1-59]